MADMTLYVRDSQDLRERWETLLFMEKMRATIDISNAPKTQAYIKKLKQAIRGYNHRKTDRRYMKGDIDGFIELIDVPQGVTDIDAWFDENESLVCMPSQYDCTGQAFTQWYKIVKRAGGYKIYHSIGFDV